MKAEEIEKYGIRAKGQAELIKFAQGNELTRGEAMLAKCYECNGGYTDGAKDCKAKVCPLYGYMPYNENRYRGKPVSDERKEALREQLKRIKKI